MTKKTKTYSVLYAEDVPFYGYADVEAKHVKAALKAARKLHAEGRVDINDPCYGSAVCQRIVHIEDPDGNTVAENITLDDFHLCKADHALRRKIDAAEAMFDALEAQEMAEYDPEASRRKGYFDRARELRQTALAQARGQQ